MSDAPHGALAHFNHPGILLLSAVICLAALPTLGRLILGGRDPFPGDDPNRDATLGDWLLGRYSDGNLLDRFLQFGAAGPDPLFLFGLIILLGVYVALVLGVYEALTRFDALIR
jgi:hypothetical protein